MCEHLQPLDNHLKQLGIKVTFRGQAWSDNCREWAYYDCFLDVENLKSKFKLPSFIIKHENTDPKSGTELGLVCQPCKDAIMGLHPEYTQSTKKTIS